MPWRDAKVHVLTHGLHYASSVFEGERMYDGEIFKLTEHTRRLFRSAELLDMDIPFSVAEIDEACKLTCSRNGLTDAYIRPVAWRGAEVMGVASEEKKRGVRITDAKWRRPDPATIPSEAKAAGLYMICTLSKDAAEREGYADAMMLDYRGYVAEMTGANVFFIKDGTIHTPLPDCFLNGITRLTLIELARWRGFDVVERHIRPEELADFSECFITGSAAEVTPVSEIGQHRFTPGNISLSLMDDYANLVRRKLVLA